MTIVHNVVFRLTFEFADHLSERSFARFRIELACDNEQTNGINFLKKNATSSKLQTTKRTTRRRTIGGGVVGDVRRNFVSLNQRVERRHAFAAFISRIIIIIRRRRRKKINGGCC
jgi:hypothetical protein